MQQATPPQTRSHSYSCHAYKTEDMRCMTQEVIKTEATSLPSLRLNMNHALVYGSADIWFSREEDLTCCLTCWLFLFWQKPLRCRPRGIDNGLFHSGKVLYTLCFPLRQTLLLRSALHIPSFQAQGGAGEGPTIAERMSSGIYAFVREIFSVWECRKHLHAKSYAY